MSRLNRSESQNGLAQPKDGSGSDLYQYYVQPGGDEEVTLLDVQLAGISKHDSKGLPLRSFTSIDELGDFTRSDENLYDIRVYSICQARSLEPLDVTKDMLSLLMAHECVPKEFMDVVKSCVYRKQPVEEAYCGNWFSNGSPTREDISYTFKYPELRETHDSDPWSIRKTCVYNSIDTHTKHSRWILLHPKYGSTGETKLTEHLAQKEMVEQYISQPIAQHILLISTYLNAWREYLVHHEEELLTLAMPIMSNQPIKPATLTRARFIESRLHPLVPIFRSYEELFTGLSALNDTLLDRQTINRLSHLQAKCSLGKMTRQITGYTDYVHHLLRKIASMAQLVSDTLALRDQQISLRNQQIAQEQNQQLTEMTRLTVQDSATVKLIGVATLVFLPTTFVATLFGTQLFYLTPTHSLAVSPHTWVLFAISVPFTILTMVWWLVRKRHHEKRRQSVWSSEEEEHEERRN